jgi:hypothetical protein
VDLANGRILSERKGYGAVPAHASLVGPRAETDPAAGFAPSITLRITADL